MLADVAPIESPSQAAALADPVKVQILERLGEPGSAASVAATLGLPRQRVAYHVRELERVGLLRHVRDQRKRNCVERILQATARRYVVSPRALGRLGATPEAIEDRFSSAYLTAVAARTADDVSQLAAAAREAGKTLPTLTLETEVRFASPDAQRGFAEELAHAVRDLVARYHDDRAADGRSFRFVVTGHPALRMGGERSVT